MGILNKTVKVIPMGTSIAHYKEKGYDAKHGRELEVNVEDLMSCSTAMVDVECDYCKETKKSIKYVNYNNQTKNGTQKYCCYNCSHLKFEEAMMEKYGCKSPIQVSEIKEKIQNTNKARYGSVSPSGNQTVREKQKKTNIKKYGVENPSQSKEIQNKIKQTNIERYGAENVFLNKGIQEKVRQTNLEKYGVENVLLSEEIREKRNATLMSKFGTLYPLQNEECLEKLKQTNMERYGVEYASQLEDIKQKVQQTCLERYGVENVSLNKEIQEKIKQTNLEKYGVEYILSLPSFHEHSREIDMERYGVYHHLQNKEILTKQKETFYKNGTCPTSKQQNYICTLYNGILNYPVKYYNADIYLPDYNLIVEYDGSGHSLGAILGSVTQEEFNQKEIIRNSVIKHEGYKQIRIISSHDLLPSDQILLQMLQDARQYFSDYPNHSWIEYNISASTLRNAEYKDGVSYDYGELRTIKNIA